VERAARNYRIQVYNSFRTDRPEYDRRQVEGQNLLRSWKRAGRGTVYSKQVIQWFEQGEQVSQAEQIASLPASPAFASLPEFAVTDAEVGDVDVFSQVDENAANGFASSDTSNFDDSGDIFDKTYESEPQRPRGILSSLRRAVFGENLNQSNNSDFSASFANADDSREPDFGDDESAPPVPENVDFHEIDVDELKAQVDGFNSSVLAIVAILGDESPIETQKLADLVDELELLIARQRDLQPYLSLEGLSTTERNHVGNIISPADTLATLHGRIEENITQLNGNVDETFTDSALLEELLERIEALLTEPNNR